MLKKRGQEGIGIVMSYANIVLNFAVGMLYTPYLIKMLGQSEYGLYLQIGALVGYMSMADFGLHSTITRYVAKYQAEHNEKEQRQFLSNCFWFYVIVTVLLSVVGCGFVANISWFLNAAISPELKHIAMTMAIFLVINIVMSLPLGMFCSILEGYGQFFLTNAIKFIGTIVRTLFLVLVLKAEYGSIGIVVIDALFNLLIPVVYALILYRRFDTRIHLIGLDFGKLREILGYSGYVFVLAIVNQFYWKIGQVILGKMISTESSAIYGLAVQVVNYATPIVLTIAGVFLPKITALVTKCDGNMSKVNELLNKVGKYQTLLIMLVFTGFVAFGRQFMLLWVGSRFETSYYVVCILLFAIIPQSIFTVGTSTLKALGKHKYQAWVYSISALVNIVIGTALAHVWGEIGMAIGTFISIALLQTPMMIYVFVKKAGLDVFHYLMSLGKQLFLPLLAACSVILLIGRIMTISNWFALLVAIIVACGVYCAIVYQWCLNSDEKKYLTTKLKQLIGG